MREREAYLQLIRATDSCSEIEDNFLPIQLSDSEGLYSPDPQSRNEGLVTAQQLVDKHIEQVERRLESEANHQTHSQTVVGALGDGLVPDIGDNAVEGNDGSPKKSEKESKRKKKKSSKKNKTNGSVVNNNSVAANTNHSMEEQKPLMTDTNELNANCPTNVNTCLTTT